MLEVLTESSQVEGGRQGAERADILSLVILGCVLECQNTGCFIFILIVHCFSCVNYPVVLGPGDQPLVICGAGKGGALTQLNIHLTTANRRFYQPCNSVLYQIADVLESRYQAVQLRNLLLAQKFE